jgi:exopolysaccharide biosynthesis polyprenyl glycosylphosphotransferase
MNLMPSIKRITLFLGDILVLYLSLWLTLFIRYRGDFDFNRWQQHFWPFTIIYLIWLIIFFIAGLYELSLARNNINFYNILLRLLRGLTINAGLAIAFFYFVPYFGITPKTNLFLNLAIFTLLFSGWRHLYNHLIKSSALLNNVLFIGQNKEINQIDQIIKDNPQLGYRAIKQIRPQDIQTPFDLLEMATQENIKTIVTAIDPHQDAKLVQSLYQCLPLKISFSDLPSFYEKILGKVPISSIGEIWFLENLTESQKNFYEAAKRILDMLGAFVFGIVSLIFCPFIILAIKIDSSGPILIKQRRIGQDGQLFILYKFRTMYATAKDGSSEPDGKPLYAQPNDPRITKVGKFLRKSRLDELPQLWNVFAGQMSFIGPRPERIEFVQECEKVTPYYQIRHIVKPGLTGWAQVNFRYGASVEDSIEKLQYELYYIKHRSFVLDLSILLRTIKIVLKGGGR